MVNRITKRFWIWVRSGWGSITLSGLVEMARRFWPVAWRRIEDVDTLRSVWEWAGGDMPALIWVATNPLFGLALVLIGLIGLPAAAGSDQNRPLHPAWLIAGWAVFCISAVILLSAVLFGQYSVSSGVLEARRFYIEKHEIREISPDQEKGITKFVCPHAGEFQPIRIMAVEGTESLHYAKEFIDAFDSCHIALGLPGNPQDFPEIIGTADPFRIGLFVPVLDKNNPDPKARRFLELMRAAGFDINFSEYEQKNIIGVPAILYQTTALFISNR